MDGGGDFRPVAGRVIGIDREIAAIDGSHTVREQGAAKIEIHVLARRGQTGDPAADRSGCIRAIGAHPGIGCRCGGPQDRDVSPGCPGQRRRRQAKERRGVGGAEHGPEAGSLFAHQGDGKPKSRYRARLGTPGHHRIILPCLEMNPIPAYLRFTPSLKQRR